MRPHEEWFSERQTALQPHKKDTAESRQHAAHYAAARVLNDWAVGQEMSGADFDAAVDGAKNTMVGG